MATNERIRDTRIEEKNEIQGLNDRLESYVAHSRSLRTVVETKEREISVLEKQHEKRISDLEKHYQAELAKLARELKAANAAAHDEAEQRTRLAADLAALKGQAKDTTELKAQIARLTDALEKALADAKANADRLAVSDAALKEERKENGRLRSELDSANGELASLRGINAKLKNEFAALQAAREADLKNAKTLLTQKVAEAKAAWDQHYKEKLEQLERELRAEYEAEIKELHEREKALVQQVDRLRKDFAAASEEAAVNQAYASDLLKRISDFERSQQEDRSAWEAAKSHLEAQLAKALADKAAKSDEFNRLMDVKITLQAEIAHYRRILEDEEARNGLPTPTKKARRESAQEEDITVTTSVHTPGGARTDSEKKSWSVLKLLGIGSLEESEESSSRRSRVTSSSVKETTTITTTSGRKRKHEVVAEPEPEQEEEEEDNPQDETPSKRRSKKSRVVTRAMEARDGAEVSAYSSSDIQVQVDLGADNVAVENRTKDVMDLSGWSLRSEHGDKRFSFPADFKLAPGKAVKVWSGPDAKTHEKYPTDLVWTRQYVWNNKGDTAMLYDADGHEVSRVYGRPAPAVVEKRKDECVIM